MLSLSFTKPSPVQSLSDCNPFLMAFLCRIASCCLCTKSVCVVKYSREALWGKKVKSRSGTSSNLLKIDMQRIQLLNASIPSEIFYGGKTVHLHEICQLSTKFLHKAITVHHNTSAYLLSKGQRDFIFSIKIIKDEHLKKGMLEREHFDN